MAGRWGIARISQEEIRVAARGRARLRVEGRGCGALRVGFEHRWVWGHFDESFSLALGEHDGEISVTLRGIGGGERRVGVLLGANIETGLQTVQATVRCTIDVPAIRRLETRGITARVSLPRIQRLGRSTALREGDGV